MPTTNLVVVHIDKNTGRIHLKPPVGQGVSTLAGLSDVNVAGVTTGQYLKFDGSKWVPSTITPGALFLDQLLDVIAPSPTDDDVLTFQSGLWVNKPNASLQGYVHHQAVPASTWTITHNKATKNAIVQVFDSAYEVVIPSAIVIVDINTVRIEYPSLETGYVHLMFFQI